MITALRGIVSPGLAIIRGHNQGDVLVIDVLRARWILCWHAPELLQLSAKKERKKELFSNEMKLKKKKKKKMFHSSK
jgi:hypothetical protein